MLNKGLKRMLCPYNWSQKVTSSRGFVNYQGYSLVNAFKSNVQLPSHRNRMPPFADSEYNWCPITLTFRVHSHFCDCMAIVQWLLSSTRAVTINDITCSSHWCLWYSTSIIHSSFTHSYCRCTTPTLCWHLSHSLTRYTDRQILTVNEKCTASTRLSVRIVKPRQVACSYKRVQSHYRTRPIVVLTSQAGYSVRWLS